eukprot:COSAG05_NODE_892_length_6724_cov_32.630491_6_plen_85_part_00
MFFAGPLVVSTASIDLLDAVNNIRLVIPAHQYAEADQLCHFLKEQNGLRGPGYMVFGMMVTPAAIGGAWISLTGVVVGALPSFL